MTNNPEVKVYLAAAWSRREEMREVAKRLKAIGIGITSRWLDQPPAHPRTPGERYVFSQRRALMDVADIRACDILIRFTDDLSEPMVPSSLLTASRMVEMGIAVERGIPIIVVGGYQPIFDYLPQVTHLLSTSSLIQYFSGGPGFVGDQNRTNEFRRTKK